jgi:gliding motility associated protien GldN
MKNRLASAGICFALTVAAFHPIILKAQNPPTPWAPLREADVMFSKRIERIIDTRQKINLRMKWPVDPLSKILYDAVAYNEELIAYRSDSLSSRYTSAEVKGMLGYWKTITVCPDPNDPYYCYDTLIYVSGKPEESIVKFKLIEDWIFDRNRSMMVVRILAIAPIYRPVAGSTGIVLPEQAMFYIDYRAARNVLVRHKPINTANQASAITFDDLFEQRLFDSYIIKESNEFDLAISEFEEYKDDPYEALLKGEEIRNKLFEFEHDLWEY